MLAAGIGAVALTGKAAGKLSAVKAPNFLKKATVKAAKFINTNKTIGLAKNSLKELSNKLPSALREAGAVTLDWAPQILLLGGLIHSLNHSSAVSKDFSKNYSDLKEKQLVLSRARQRELQLENDFLKTDVKNREDLALVNDPLKDMPDEVIEKVEELNDDELEV